ncbi:MAG: LapA family protein [Burkholderiales bacterium]
MPLFIVILAAMTFGFLLGCIGWLWKEMGHFRKERHLQQQITALQQALEVEKAMQQMAEKSASSNTETLPKELPLLFPR